MPKYKIKYTFDSQNDIDAIFNYICQHLSNPVAAIRTVSKIASVCDGLMMFPKGNPIKLSSRNVDFRFVHAGKYTIIYHVNDIDKIVYIDYIMYSRRDIMKIIAG